MKTALMVIMIMMFVPFMGAVDGSTSTYDIQMEVEDTFTYTPQVNLTDTVITCTGTAMESEGGFLVFKDGTLFGEAKTVGAYQVTIQAHWEHEGLVQDAYQVINFIIVGQTAPSYSNYVAVGPVGSIALIEEEVPVYGPTDEGTDDKSLVLMLIIAAIVLAIVAIVLAIYGFIYMRRD